jgi:hypothetical protein
VLDDAFAQRDLAVSGQNHFAVAAHAKHGRAVYLRRISLPVHHAIIPREPRFSELVSISGGGSVSDDATNQELSRTESAGSLVISGFLDTQRENSKQSYRSGSGCEASAIESAELRNRLLTVLELVSFQIVGKSWAMSLQPLSAVMQFRLNAHAARFCSSVANCPNSTMPFHVGPTLRPCGFKSKWSHFISVLAPQKSS